MVKLIKRTTDNKFLQSLENNLWVNDIKEAFEMTYRECEDAKLELMKEYQEEEIKEIINLQKLKQITEEEKKELIALLIQKKI